MNNNRKNAEERRLEIIRGTRELFRTRDYESTTMQEITGRLNIARGTVYHYFTSKQELLEAVVEDIVNDELMRKRELLKMGVERGLNALEKLKLLVTEDESVHINEKILCSLSSGDNARIHTRQLGRYITELAPLYASVFRDGCEEGVFRTDYPLECAEFIIAGVRFLTESGFYPWHEAQLNRRIRAIPFLIEAQLSALAGSFLFFNNNQNNNKELIK